ncbi:MAG: hypothetical protein IJ156_01275 [Bacteroidales bacterium]|nr:hypothetical protein [Bacteroidales bacterium]
MKRMLPLLLLLSCLTAAAQQYDVLDQVRADRRKACAMEGPHRFEIPAPTPSPKGYKPFYISHYGRHGSRYAWNARTYSTLHEALSQAHGDGALTPLGEQFYERFESFYQVPLINTGDLVPLGFEQHKRIAAWTYDAFPEVFRKGKKVDAIVSTAPRSIVSMSSFCLSLKEKEPKLDFFQRSNHVGLTVVTPTSAPRELRRKFREDDISHVETVAHFNERFIDYEGILGRIFKDPAYPSRFSGGRTGFVNEMHQLVTGYHNYEEAPLFDDLLTDDQYVQLWESDNYASFYADLTARYGNIPLLEDIIAKAESAFRDPSKAADLRFGHDYVLEAFLCLVNANGCGTVPEKASDVKYWFQSYNIPMAATVLFVFYRNKKGDILFKTLLNETEVSFPQLEPVSGPYYRWSDFTAWATMMMAAHPEVK